MNTAQETIKEFKAPSVTYPSAKHSNSPRTIYTPVIVMVICSVARGLGRGGNQCKPHPAPCTPHPAPAQQQNFNGEPETPSSCPSIRAYPNSHRYTLTDGGASPPSQPLHCRCWSEFAPVHRRRQTAGWPPASGSNLGGPRFRNQ
jgi:hypothetical protein